MTAIMLDRLTVSYRGRAAVQDVTGRFEPGSMTAIIGPNGAGKSTLLQAIAGLLMPDGGRVQVDVDTVREVAWLPQQPTVDRSLPLSVSDLVALGAWPRIGATRALSAALAEQVQAALHRVGLQGLGQRLIHELSAGQWQRVLFARAVMQEARIILLDEPFNAIDARTTADLLTLVGHWHREGRTVVAVLHDLAQVREHFNETLLLARRCIAWGPTADVLQAEPLQLAQRTAQAWDDDASVWRQVA